MSTERIIEAACDMLEALSASFYQAAKICGEQQTEALKNAAREGGLYERSRALILQGMATAHKEDARYLEARIVELRNYDGYVAPPRLELVSFPSEEKDH